MNIERILNSVTEHWDSEMLDLTLQALLDQLDVSDPTSYRLAFHNLLSDGKLTLAISLLAHRSDPRMQALLHANKVTLRTEADYVFILHGYSGFPEWLRNAQGITKLFPEQPDKAEFAITPE